MADATVRRRRRDTTGDGPIPQDLRQWFAGEGRMPWLLLLEPVPVVQIIAWWRQYLVAHPGTPVPDAPWIDWQRG